MADNLVLKAARALAERVEGLEARPLRPVQALAGRGRARRRLGRCRGGVAPAGARQRHRARRSRGCMQAARATGADVPVCLDPRRASCAASAIFCRIRWTLPTVARGAGQSGRGGGDQGGVRGASMPWTGCDASLERNQHDRPSSTARRSAISTANLRPSSRLRNDLEAPAIWLQPVIARGARRAARALRAAVSRACRARARPASVCSIRGVRRRAAARRAARPTHPDWWVRATMSAISTHARLGI